ncbi:MAG: biotin/lipoyl-binding protein [Proteobacteria bacterium]|nr:biotin/lipoyl-binding protein [Pseudomonadota bacterium]
MKYTVRCGKKRSVKIDRRSDFSGEVDIMVGKKKYTTKIKDTFPDGRIKTVLINNKVYPVQVERREDGFPCSVALNGIPYDVEILKVESTRYRPPTPQKTISGKVKSGLPGQIAAILVEEGAKVQKGQPLLILESMKMENEILAHKSGTVNKIFVTPGQLVMKGHLMIEIS